MKPRTRWDRLWSGFVLALYDYWPVDQYRWGRQALGGRWTAVESIFYGWFWVKNRDPAVGRLFRDAMAEEDWRSDEEKLADMLREEV